ncbi:HAD-IIIA family hydrolase [Quadrisphaera sp. DSM 44207]|uniref:HAD-IIIA family hydrolase n=1 Tax=Quadrisphaera sp. DSM 44207 TaxID=1881057 RepID=UPI00087F94DB|nr:HAD-IIIA family hydrolase [Quadrisphaera sp. DSM 44207]SDQ04049.1 histidinol-phosphate phosphatase family domain-containing protein/HAD-superfamily hydrolase, subfamily IIIA [Quadrisphaera sp. DSM 44207]
MTPGASSGAPASDLLRFAVVVPTVGRPSLQRLLDTLAGQDGPAPAEVLVVDDRPGTDVPPLRLAGGAGWQPRVVRSRGRGPAAARNLGWRLSTAPWVAFLDDDVELPAGWARALVADLAAAGERTGASKGRLHVPLPAGRRPTDWERGTKGLETAHWATADMAYRREALEAVGGFDERFPRAYREDADLALRVRRAGWELAQGRRTTTHPVRPADDRVSLRVQRGNADDALMRHLHGPSWRADAQAPPGRLPWHAATCAAAGAALGAAVLGRRRGAALAAAAWVALTADFARRRIAPGPRDAAEVRRMVLTSAAIPLAAVVHRVRGEVRHRRRRTPAWPPPVRAVLLDRDGTLVHDVPYNGDPALVRPVEGAAEALAALRAAGVRLGVVTNQSGIARGLLTREQVDAVDAAVDAALGPFETWQVCPHGPEDGCACRKPAPGMVLAGAAALGVPVEQVAVVGDIGADVGAAQAAGARGVLVPTPATRPEEVADAPLVAPDLAAAVRLLLGGPR